MRENADNTNTTGENMRRVALITDGWKRMFTYAWPAGILQRIQQTQEEVNLYIFNSTGNWNKDASYNKAEYNIFNLPDLREFDGIILELNNISSAEVLREVTANAKASGVPVVSIANELEDFYYVGIDIYAAMKMVIAHLHEKHGFWDFWFLMGEEDNYESRQRLAGLVDYTKEHRIYVPADKIWHGNYDFRGGQEGFQTLWKRHHRLPQAIICVNDNVAVAACEEAAALGFHAPRDFTVTGFDNFDKAGFYMPSITTVGHVREAAAYLGMDVLLRIWRGEYVPRHNFTGADLFLHESCGCGWGSSRDVRQHMKDRIVDGLDNEEFDEEVLTMEAAMMQCDTVEEMMCCISKSLPSFHCDGMYLVLDDHINDYQQETEESIYLDLAPADTAFQVWGYPKRMRLVFAYDADTGICRACRQERGVQEEPFGAGEESHGAGGEPNGAGEKLSGAEEEPRGASEGSHSVYGDFRGAGEKPRGTCEETRRAGEEIEGIFPTFACEKPGQSLLFLPLHFRERTVGYVVLRNGVYLMEKYYLFKLLNVLTCSMEHLHKKEILTYMNRRLGSLYIMDQLTGLYNRAGYKKLGTRVFRTARREQKKLTILFADVDRLKYINDTYGHDCGDAAIRTAAQALQRSAPKDAVAARMGGDEFIVITEQRTEEEILQMMENIRQALDDQGKEQRLPFRVEMSLGAVVADPSDGSTLEDYVRKADAQMYQEKTDKKANRPTIEGVSSI